MSADTADLRLRIANAALAEVGEYAVFRAREDGFLYLRTHEASNLDMAYRAILLARMAIDGPGALVYCRACRINGWREGRERCTPVRDALRGVTCQLTKEKP